MTSNERIAAVLLANGWAQDGENPCCFYDKYRALYTYPGMNRLKYWPDIRWFHNVSHERTMDISESELLELIRQE